MGKAVNKSARIYNVALSKREVQLLAEWERGRQVFITTQDIESRVGTVAAGDVARGSTLSDARKAKLMRQLCRGVVMVNYWNL